MEVYAAEQEPQRCWYRVASDGEVRQSTCDEFRVEFITLSSERENNVMLKRNKEVKHFKSRTAGCSNHLWSPAHAVNIIHYVGLTETHWVLNK